MCICFFSAGAQEQLHIDQLPVSAAVKKAQSLSPHVAGGTLFTKRQRAKTDSQNTIKEEDQSSPMEEKMTPRSAPDALHLTSPQFLQQSFPTINGDVENVMDMFNNEPPRHGRPRTPPDEREDEAHYRSLHGAVEGLHVDDEELDFRDDQAPISPILQLDKAVSATDESPQIDIENEDEVGKNSLLYHDQ